MPRPAIGSLFSASPSEQSAEQASLLRGDAYALAINGIEAADCVGDWQKAARERLKALEMAEHALGKSRSARFRPEALACLIAL